MPDPEAVKVDHDNPPVEYTPPDINMAEAIPPDLREKAYFKGKSFVDVIKEHDNLQTLMGKRPAGIPTEDSSDDEWGTFLSSLRPKTADEYVLPETEFSKAKGRSDDYVKGIKEVLYNADINKRQAEKIMTGFEEFLSKTQTLTEEQIAEKAKVRETEFEGLLDTTYGSDKQAVIDRTKKLMTDSVDSGLKDKVAGVLKDIPNDTLFALTAVLDGVYKKHIAEDKPPDGADPSGGDAVGWQTEAEGIMRSDSYKDFRNPGYDAARQRVQELFGKIASITKK